MGFPLRLIKDQLTKHYHHHILDQDPTTLINIPQYQHLKPNPKYFNHFLANNHYHYHIKDLFGHSILRNHCPFLILF